MADDAAVHLIFSNLAILIPVIPIIASFIVLFAGKYYDKKAYGNMIALVATGTRYLIYLFQGKLFSDYFWKNSYPLANINWGRINCF